MGIEVTCTGADLLPIDKLVDFQGNLKTISNQNIEKLKRSIIKNGFTAPIFVWQNEGNNFILDGHQRIKALYELMTEGMDIPLLPVAYIYADNEIQAKEKLLYITSQYGEFTNDGYFEFANDIDFDLNDINLRCGEFSTNLNNYDIDFDDINASDNGIEVVCPKCGFMWNK